MGPRLLRRWPIRAVRAPQRTESEREGTHYGGPRECSYFFTYPRRRTAATLCFHSNRVNFLEGCRSGPGFCFLQAVERDDDKPLGRSSIKRGNIFSTHDELPAGSSYRRPGFGINRLESFRVCDLADVNDSISWRRGLGVEPLDDCPADGDASNERKSKFVIGFHKTFSLFDAAG